MIGFAASLLGEALTGKGILAQLNLETGNTLNSNPLRISDNQFQSMAQNQQPIFQTKPPGNNKNQQTRSLVS
jgi:hypothetical protein